MQVGTLHWEYAYPGDPLVVEKHFIQNLCHSGVKPLWQDAFAAPNTDGFLSLEIAQEYLDRIRGHYVKGTSWRIIKRTCTVETEVIK